MTRTAAFTLCLALCAAPAAWGQDLTVSVSNRLLFDADATQFILLNNDIASTLPAAQISGWEAEGLDPQDALELSALIAGVNSLTPEAATQLETLTRDAVVRFTPPSPEPEAAIAPNPGIPNTGGTGIPDYIPAKGQICPDGTELPVICSDPDFAGKGPCTC